MKFLNNGDLSFMDLEAIMFEGGLKRTGRGDRKRRRILTKGQQLIVSPVNHPAPLGVGPLNKPEPPPVRGGFSAEPTATASRFELTAVVTQIPKSASREDVANFFRERCGNVIDVKFVPGNSSIACVQFSDPHAMEKAVNGLSHPAIRGQVVLVRPSLEVRQQLQHNKTAPRYPAVRGGEEEVSSAAGSVNKPPPVGGSGGPAPSLMASPLSYSRKIRVSNLPKNASVPEIRQMYQRYGDVESTDMHYNQEKPVCDIVFRTLKAANEAAHATDGYLLGGDFLHVIQATDAPGGPK